jgi:undecaprenyl-diphosphatase
MTADVEVVKRTGLLSARSFISPLVLFALVVGLGLIIQSGASAAIDTSLFSTFALRAGEGNDGLIAFWQGISWSGGGAQRYVIVAALALLLGYWHHWRSGVALVVMAIASNSVSGYLKDVFARPRPNIVPHLDHVNSLSYPSGHATSAALVYLLFALLVPTERRGLWLTVGGVAAALTGFSRVALGVHWPTDVIGGWMLGGAFALLGLAISTDQKPS